MIHLSATRTFADPEALTQGLVDLLADFYMQTDPPDAASAIMLAGGSTPLAAYRYLQENPITISPTRWTLLSDERLVPIDTPENNFYHINGMLKACGTKNEEHVMRVHTEHAAEEAATRYGRALRSFIKQGGRIPLGNPGTRRGRAYGFPVLLE